MVLLLEDKESSEYSSCKIDGFLKRALFSLSDIGTFLICFSTSFFTETPSGLKTGIYFSA